MIVEIIVDSLVLVSVTNTVFTLTDVSTVIISVATIDDVSGCDAVGKSLDVIMVMVIVSLAVIIKVSTVGILIVIVSVGALTVTVETSKAVLKMISVSEVVTVSVAVVIIVRTIESVMVTLLVAMLVTVTGGPCTKEVTIEVTTGTSMSKQLQKRRRETVS